MNSNGPKVSATRFAPAILAGGAGGIVWALLQFWGANPEYVDRFLILAASGWVAWNARATPRARQPSCASASFHCSRGGRVPGRLVPPGAGRPETGRVKPHRGGDRDGGYLLVTGMVAPEVASFPGFVRGSDPNRIWSCFNTPSATTTPPPRRYCPPCVPVEERLRASLPNGDLGVAEACSGRADGDAAFVAWQAA